MGAGPASLDTGRDNFREEILGHDEMRRQLEQQEQTIRQAQEEARQAREETRQAQAATIALTARLDALMRLIERQHTMPPPAGQVPPVEQGQPEVDPVVDQAPPQDAPATEGTQGIPPVNPPVDPPVNIQPAATAPVNPEPPAVELPPVADAGQPRVHFPQGQDEQSDIDEIASSASERSMPGIAQRHPTGGDLALTHLLGSIPGLPMDARALNVPRPELFDPATAKQPVQSWLRDVDIYFEATGYASAVHDEKKITFAAALLRGGAKEWWWQVCSLPSAITPYSGREVAVNVSVETCGVSTRPTTWPEFKGALTRQFTVVSPSVDAYRQLNQLRQTSDVIRYAATFRALTSLIPDMTPAEQARRFVEGLRNELRKEVIRADCETMEEMARVAQRMEPLYPRPTEGSSHGGQYNRRDRSYRRTDGDRYRSTKQFGAVTGAGETRTCYLCGKRGHIARNCPEKDKHGSSGNGQRQ